MRRRQSWDGERDWCVQDFWIYYVRLPNWCANRLLTNGDIVVVLPIVLHCSLIFSFALISDVPSLAFLLDTAWYSPLLSAILHFSLMLSYTVWYSLCLFLIPRHCSMLSKTWKYPMLHCFITISPFSSWTFSCLSFLPVWCMETRDLGHSNCYCWIDAGSHASLSVSLVSPSPLFSALFSLISFLFFFFFFLFCHLLFLVAHRISRDCNGISNRTENASQRSTCRESKQKDPYM